ncbi:hypothetical protein ANCCAN_10354 [Ancylostoma caninum]|uniref:Uncharacterized protein n=1 Tax=Ancylostoma caninum TaxID=29170 RepID=A0A368GKY6_ANCCA|nr:hypothetical protein ANCCAN_10354 [Ancylostoma caninum]
MAKCAVLICSLMLRRVYIVDLHQLHSRIQKVLQERCNNGRM